MKKIVCITVVAILACSVGALAGGTSGKGGNDEDVEVITKLIVRSYLHGAFNELNPDAMRAGFHPDFAIFSAKGEEISKYPIADWADSVERRKSDPGFDPRDNKWDYKIATIDVTGGAAAVKVELSKDGALVYTDYLSLLEFDSGWRIVAKVYHKHGSE
jgi:hypothetical protein